MYEVICMGMCMKCVCVWLYIYTHHGTHVEIRGQLCKVGSLLSAAGAFAHWAISLTFKSGINCTVYIRPMAVPGMWLIGVQSRGFKVLGAAPGTASMVLWVETIHPPTPQGQSPSLQAGTSPWPPPPSQSQRPVERNASCRSNSESKTSECQNKKSQKLREGSGFLVTHVGDFRAPVQRNKLNYGGGSSAICNHGLFEILLEEN